MCIFGDGSSKWLQVPALSSSGVRTVVTIKEHSPFIVLLHPQAFLTLCFQFLPEFAHSGYSGLSASKLSLSHTGIMKAEGW